MDIRSKVSAFTSQLGNAVSQLNAGAQSAGTSVANTFTTAMGQVRNQAANIMPLGQQAMLSSQERMRSMLGAAATRIPGSIQRTGSQLGGFVPEMMNQYNIPGRAAVTAFQQSPGNFGGIPGLTNSRALGYGTAAATLGAAALGGAAVNQLVRGREKKDRVAGELLGQQLLGKGMPGRPGPSVTIQY